MFEIIITESIEFRQAYDPAEAGIKTQQNVKIERLKLTVDTIDLPAVIAAVMSQPKPPRARRKDYGTKRELPMPS